MSLAPAAYLLFQKVMRHNPADPHWPGRDRFVLSAGHSSLTLYLQLFLGGWGLELEDIKSLRTWGSKTPGHPEYGHTAGVETTTGPLGQGIGNAVGMAMAARKERGLLDPNAAEGASPFDHRIFAICSDGDIEEGVSAEASAIAGVQRLGNLTVLYDANRISIEDNTDIALAEDVGARYEAYGWHVQTVDWTHDETTYVEDVPALHDAIKKADAVTDRPSFIVLRTIIAWPAPERPEHRRGARLRTGRRRGGGHQGGARLRPRPRPSRSRPACSSTPVSWSPGARRPRRPGTPSSSTGPRSRRPTSPSTTGCRRGPCPVGWADDLPTFDADPKGVATRKASGAVINAIAAEGAGVLGRLGRPGRVQQHHHRGRTVVPAERPRHQDVAGRPLRRPGAALRHPRARHGRDPQRHRRCTAAPASSAAPS